MADSPAPIEAYTIDGYNDAPMSNRLYYGILGGACLAVVVVGLGALAIWRGLPPGFRPGRR